MEGTGVGWYHQMLITGSSQRLCLHGLWLFAALITSFLLLLFVSFYLLFVHLVASESCWFSSGPLKGFQLHIACDRLIRRSLGTIIWRWYRHVGFIHWWVWLSQKWAHLLHWVLIILILWIKLRSYLVVSLVIWLLVRLWAWLSWLALKTMLWRVVDHQCWCRYSNSWLALLWMLLWWRLLVLRRILKLCSCTANRVVSTWSLMLLSHWTSTSFMITHTVDTSVVLVGELWSVLCFLQSDLQLSHLLAVLLLSHLCLSSDCCLPCFLFGHFAGMWPLVLHLEQ